MMFTIAVHLRSVRPERLLNSVAEVLFVAPPTQQACYALSFVLLC
jgi:hypothetical protein